MNCKPGDLAVVVRSVAGNEGKIVRCLRLIPSWRWTRPNGERFTGPGWVTEPGLQGWNGTKAVPVPDQQLRPIRDPGDDARDETLDWLPSPTKETTA